MLTFVMGSELHPKKISPQRKPKVYKHSECLNERKCLKIYNASRAARYNTSMILLFTEVESVHSHAWPSMHAAQLADSHRRDQRVH